MSATARNAPCPCGSGRKFKLCCAEHQPAHISLVRLDPLDDPRQGWSEERLEQEIAMLESDEPHATNRLGVSIERRAVWRPRRAQRVWALFDAVAPASPKRRPGKSKAAALRARNHPTRHTGHPRRLTRDAKRRNWLRPDKDEQAVRDIAHKWRQQRTERKDRGDGDMSGLLAVAGELAALEIGKHLAALADPEPQAALTEYLYGIWGELVHRFAAELTPSEALDGLPAYTTWRGGRGPIEPMTIWTEPPEPVEHLIARRRREELLEELDDIESLLGEPAPGLFT